MNFETYALSVEQFTARVIFQITARFASHHFVNRSHPPARVTRKEGGWFGHSLDPARMSVSCGAQRVENKSRFGFPFAFETGIIYFRHKHYSSHKRFVYKRAALLGRLAARARLFRLQLVVQGSEATNLEGARAVGSMHLHFVALFAPHEAFADGRGG